MKVRLIQACYVVLVVSVFAFHSCRKESTTAKTEQTESGQSVIKKNQSLVNSQSSKPTKLFSGQVIVPFKKSQNSLNDLTGYQGRGPCNYTFGGILNYSIVSLPCIGGVNEYRMDFTFYFHVVGAISAGINTEVTEFNSFTLSNPSQYTYSYGVPPTPDNLDGNGFTFTGSVIFSDVHISCGMSTADLNFSGHCWSYLCNPGDDYNLTISVPLRPSACSISSPTAEIYPNISFNNGEFWVFFPWDFGCFEECFLPNDWTDLELEYYKSPNGTHHSILTGMTPFDWGPYVVTVSEGAGTYYVRGRYKCSGGGNSAWSAWSAVPVN